MIWFPPAKVNLGLHVLRKRADGYHDIDTCFYPTPWKDILEIIPSDKLEFLSSGLNIPGDPKENLCLKAYHLIKEDRDIPPVTIYLHKIIPMGAGLGGGSADAAYTLRGLNDIFELSLTQKQLHAYASKIGSDCAFFIHDQPMLATGRGDVLEQVDLQLDKEIVIVYPNIHINTADAYRDTQPIENRVSLSELISYPVHQWKEHLKNDFEYSVFKKYPKIEKVKRELYDLGADYASLSGSGSAVFGLFDDVPESISETFSDYTIFYSKRY